MIKAVIFDYYGVIQPDVLTATYEHFGGDPEADKQFIADTIYAVNSGQVETSKPIFAKHLGISLEEWTQALTERRTKDPDLLDYVAGLRKKGYKTALLSNVGRGGLQMMWAEGELKKYFDEAVASGDVGFIKPSPEIFHLMSERLGVQPNECILVDDQADNCAGARAVGMQAILYEHLGQFKKELEKLLNSSET